MLMLSAALNGHPGGATSELSAHSSSQAASSSLSRVSIASLSASALVMSRSKSIVSVL